MTHRLSLWLLPLLTGACFRAPNDAVEALTHVVPTALLVNDLAGASFAPSAIPRDPTFDLAFEVPLGAGAEQRVALLRGLVEPTLAAQLNGSRPSAVQKARTVALQVERRPGVVRVQPKAALIPGAHYSLVWQSEPPEVFVLRVAGGTSLGAQLVESAPGADQPGVPAQLTWALVRFDGAVQGDLAAHIALRTAAGEAVATQVTVEPCAARGLPAGDCAWLHPRAPLLPGTGYQLALQGGLSAASGAPIAPAVTAFEVAAQADDAPPRWLATACAPDELSTTDVCTRVDDRALYVRGSVSTQALVELVLPDADEVHRTATLSHAGAFALELPCSGAAHSALLRATDLAGHISERTLSFTLADDLAQLAIDEVRADPLGKEPAQEYVELLNFGPTPVSLMGFTLTKDAREHGHALVSAVTLSPGERVLAVSPSFDPQDDADGPLPPGARLALLDAPLSLANGGQVVLLRDPRGRRVAAGQALAPLVAGQCSARLVEASGSAPEREANDLRSGDERWFELDPTGSCTPASASFLGARDAGALAASPDHRAVDAARPAP